MPIIFQKMIYREDLLNNPDVLYVFGDNLVRKGRGGQAKEMRGEPNAIGVATKNTPEHGERHHYFSDDNLEEQKKVIDKDLKPVYIHLDNGGTVVYPLDGIGTGLSKLNKYSPKTEQYIDVLLDWMINWYNDIDFYAEVRFERQVLNLQNAELSGEALGNNV